MGGVEMRFTLLIQGTFKDGAVPIAILIFVKSACKLTLP